MYTLQRTRNGLAKYNSALRVVYSHYIIYNIIN